MNSTERAPEPTMEEILASIRRIISDDEANSNHQEATSSDYAGPVAVEDTDDSAADTQMIDDIARVLSSAAPSSAESEEDILDLDEPEELVLEAPADAEMIVTEEIILTEVYAEPEPEAYAEVPPAPNFSAAFPPSSDSETAEGFAVEDEAPAEPLAEEPIVAEAPESAEMFAAEEIVIEMPPPVEEATAEMLPQMEEAAPAPAPEIPSLDDPTSALERAIAALKAGDLAAFAREAQSGYGEPAPAAEAQPEAEAPLAAAEPEAAPELAAEPEVEALALEEELILDEQAVEPSPEAWSEESTSWPEPEMELAPDEQAQPDQDPAAEAAIEAEIEEEQAWAAAAPEPEPESEPEPAYGFGANHVNGGSAHKARDYESPIGAKTLEDSVKEMLRPMLKAWLEENMPRVLDATLREELNNLERRGN
jgi:cell pole-organizing protein PopZ